MNEDKSKISEKDILRDFKIVLICNFLYCFAAAGTALWLINKASIVASQVSAEDQYTSHFNQSKRISSVEHTTPPPYLHIMRNIEGVRSELNDCGIEPLPNTPIYICEDRQTVYFDSNVFTSIVSESKISFWDRRLGEWVPERYLEYFAELGVAKYIASKKQPSTNSVDVATTAYCLVGKSSSAKYNSNLFTKILFVKKHFQVADLINEDIPLEDQVNAFEKGWSDEVCY